MRLARYRCLGTRRNGGEMVSVQNGLRLGMTMLVACCIICAGSVAALASTERTFELVSPLYKGGFGATFIEAVAQNGNGVAYFSPGEFEGAPAGLSNNANGLDYLSRRGSGGWSTV